MHVQEYFDRRYNGLRSVDEVWSVAPSYIDMAAKITFTNDTKMNSKEDFKASSLTDVQTGNLRTPSRLKYWAKRLTVETGGIERVTDEDRAHNASKVWNACTFW